MPKKKSKQKSAPALKRKGQVPYAIRIRIVQAVMRGATHADAAVAFGVSTAVIQKFMGLFEAELARVTAIAFFTPLIQATGGNVGIQSSSLIVQSLANPDFVDVGLWKRLVKVFFVAILNGLFLAGVVFLANILLFDETRLSTVVSVALFSVIVFASFIGTVTPLILNRFGFNPALAAGPFITTTNDLLGLTIYFFTVHIVL